jgi:hypothetical protein
MLSFYPLTLSFGGGAPIRHRQGHGLLQQA